MTVVCTACGGRGWTEQDWDSEAKDFGEEVFCPHCSGDGVDWWSEEEEEE